MGSRKGASAKSIWGSRPVASKNQTHLQQKLRDASSKAVAETAFQAVAQSNPTVGALYLAYRVAKFTYPIVKDGVEEYAKTGDTNKALEKMKEETVKQVGNEVKGAIIDTIIGSSVDAVRDSAHIAVNETTSTFVKTAISETISELIE
jgi:hypothetical protein